MKKFAAVSIAALMFVGAPAHAFFGDSDKYSDPECWYNPDCNPYDPWDPRYWMEEMDSFWNDSNDYGYGGYGGPMGGPYGRPMMPYGGMPGAMPYGAPAMPYGAPAPAAPYGMPYRPQMPAPYAAPRPAPRPAPAPAPASK